MKTFKTFIEQQVEIEEAYDGPSPNSPKRVTDTTYHVSDYRVDGNGNRQFTTREIHKSKVKDHYRSKFGEKGAKVLSKHPHFNEEVEIEEGRKPTMAAAVNRAEKSRQRAIKRAGMQAKRMGGSDEAVKNAMRDHDVFSRDEKHVRSHLGETATTSDKAPVIVPAHKSASGKRIPAKAVMRAKHRAIVNKNDNPNDGE